MQILFDGCSTIWAKMTLIPLFVQTSVANPVHFFGPGSADLVLKIWIRVTQKGRIRIRILLRYVLDVYQNKYLCYGIFIPNLNILRHVKTKIKKLFWQNCILDNFNYRCLFVYKGSGSGIFHFDPKRPDPTGSGSGSATLLQNNILIEN